MAEITLKALTKRFGQQVIAVNDLDLLIPNKEFVALLGPSGCGKTTTMNMIAGIEQPTGGEILFDGVDMVRRPPEKRGVGFVFQNYAIFTHMTVYDNLAFGPQVQGWSSDKVAAKVKQMADLMRLTDRLDWPSAKLSVNEMQKLAIGRSAIVEPTIFLLDEPLSNLDASFREFMRTELKRIQHQLQQTMVYVTHDQIEAMSLADRIAVMDRGVLQQYGTPAEIYNRPANTFVANFMGSPPMNLLDCKIQRDGATLYLDLGQAGRLAIQDPALQRAAEAAKRPEVVLGVRPEAVSVMDDPEDVAGLAMTVDLLEPIGPRTIIHLKSGEMEMLAVEDKRFGSAHASRVTALLPQAQCHLFDADSGFVLGRDDKTASGQEAA
ncbi:MAG: ABC transporter ATP-binding protein [Rhodospirillales bacterium]